MDKNPKIKALSLIRRLKCGDYEYLAQGHVGPIKKNFNILMNEVIELLSNIENNSTDDIITYWRSVKEMGIYILDNLSLEEQLSEHFKDYEQYEIEVKN